jgi:hypothetical protein
MKIVLDSTVLIKNFNLTGPSFRLLEWYIEKSSSELVVPKIILLEVQNKYRETVKELFDKIKNPLARLSRLTQIELNGPLSAINLDDVFIRYDAQLLRTLSSLNTIFPDFKDIPHDDLINRDLNRRKPFQKSGKGYRDALFWEVILRKVAQKDSKTVLISDNTNDFFDKNDTGLHPELREDLNKHGISSDDFLLYRNLESFIDEYVKTIIPAIEEAKISLEKGDFHNFSLKIWFDENLSNLNHVFEKDLKNISFGIQYDIETYGISWIEEPSQLAVNEAYDLEKDRVAIGCSLEAFFTIDLYIHNFFGDYNELPFEILYEESDHYGAFITAYLKLPINVTLIFNIDTEKVEEYDGEFVEIYGWCNSCGEPYLSDAAETCSKCGM